MVIGGVGLLLEETFMPHTEVDRPTAAERERVRALSNGSHAGVHK